MFVSITERIQGFWGNRDAENQESTNAASLWNYSQTFLKAVGILAVGGVAYTFFRSLTSSAPSSENTLNTKTEKHVVNALQQNDIQLAVKPSFIESTQFDITYQDKREVIPVTDEFLVNTYTTDPQIFPAIAALTNGDFVITWQSLNQVSDTSGNDIYAQRFASNGARLGSEFLVNIDTLDEQRDPSVAALDNDEFVIAWSGNGQTAGPCIYAQRFAGDGTALGSAFSVNTPYQGGSEPTIAVLPNKDFVVTWYSFNYDVYARRFAGNGTALDDAFMVNTYTTNIQYMAAIAVLTNGDFVITWESINQVNSVSQSDIYAQRFSSNGIKLGSEFLVNTYTTSQQNSPIISGLANGDFVITWQSEKSGNIGAYAQRFANDGTPLGNEFLVGSLGALTYSPNVAGLANGQFVFTWLGGDNKIYAQHFASNGTSLDVAVMVNMDTSYTRQKPTIVGLPNSQFVIVWQSYNQASSTSDYDLYAKILTASYELPMLFNNALAIGQGQNIIFEQANLLANSGSSTTFNDLLFVVQDLQHGQFTRTNQPALPIYNFTQAELNKGLIRFAHEDSLIPPSYQIVVDDGANTTAPQIATIEFYKKPQIIRNQFTIADGTSIQVTANELLAITDRSDFEIIFNVQNISHGVFSLNDAAFPFANVVMTFSQSQINGSQIWFVHDGSNLTANYSIQARFNGVASTYQLSDIVFIPSPPSSPNAVNNSPVGQRNTGTIIGAVVGVTGGALLLAGLGIFGRHRYKKTQKNAKERARYPLANALHEALKIKRVDNFQSNQGASFVNAVDALSNELSRIGIDVQQMTPDELSILAEKLARAIKAQVQFEKVFNGIELNSLDIEEHAQAIVQTAQTLGRLVITDIHELEMNSMGQKNASNRFTEYMQQRGINLDQLTSTEMNNLVDIVSVEFKN